MAEIKTRIALKIDTFENWSKSDAATQANKTNGDLVLKRGEIGFCEIPASSNEATTAPTILFKVGDGEKPFKSLKWASALAADVYSWAKCSTVELDGEIIKFHNGDKTNPVHTIDLSKFALDEDLGDVDTLTTTAKTAVGAINEHDAEIGDLSTLNTNVKSSLVGAINEALQAVETGGTGSVVTIVKDTDTANTDTYTVKQGGKAVGDKVTIGTADLTVEGTGALEGTGTFNANSSTDKTISITHKTSGVTAAQYGADEAVTVGAGETKTINIPSVTVDSYGHVTAAADKQLSIAIPTIPTELGVMSVAGSGAITATGDKDVTVGLKLDNSGEVTLSQGADGLKADIDLSNYKTKQSVVSDPTANGSATAFIDSITQNANGEITVTKKNITAADLGLTKVMDFLGTTTTALADGSNTNPVQINGEAITANNGDVVLSGNKEFVFDGTYWKELGDQGSHALKTVTITGTGYLTGGGDLTQNRTIDIDGSIKTKIDNGATAYGWGDHSTQGYLKETDITDKANKVTGATAGNFAVLKADGDLANSEYNADSFDAAGTAQELIDGLDLDNKLDAKLNANGWTDNSEKDGWSAISNDIHTEFGPTQISFDSWTTDRSSHINNEEIQLYEQHGTYHQVTFTARGLTTRQADSYDGMEELPELISVNYPTQSGTLAVTDDITAAVQALDSSVSATAEADGKVSVLTGVTQTDGKLTAKTEVTLGKLAKKDVITSTDFADEVFVFDCGTSDTVI